MEDTENEKRLLEDFLKMNGFILQRNKLLASGERIAFYMHPYSDLRTLVYKSYEYPENSFLPIAKFYIDNDFICQYRYSDQLRSFLKKILIFKKIER